MTTYKKNKMRDNGSTSLQFSYSFSVSFPNNHIYKSLVKSIIKRNHSSQIQFTEEKIIHIQREELDKLNIKTITLEYPCNNYEGQKIIEQLAMKPPIKKIVGWYYAIETIEPRTTVYLELFCNENLSPEDLIISTDKGRLETPVIRIPFYSRKTAARYIYSRPRPFTSGSSFLYEIEKPAKPNIFGKP